MPRGRPSPQQPSSHLAHEPTRLGERRRDATGRQSNARPAPVRMLVICLAGHPYVQSPPSLPR
eukprot:5649803-Pyramimonas_sp.AAC.1